MARDLQDLNLSPEQRESLSRQGFVASEFRGSRGPFFKLRFRCGGRQIVRYLGTDPATANRVQQEVRALQHEHRLTNELARLTRQARRLLRETKIALQPYVFEAGYRFHGFEIRKPR
jgi:hypothetical protein